VTSLEDFDSAAATVAGLVTALADDQRALPTACVVDHLAHGNAKVAFWAGLGGAAMLRRPPAMRACTGGNQAAERCRAATTPSAAGREPRPAA
jgi:hypothetical protein